MRIEDVPRGTADRGFCEYDGETCYKGSIVSSTGDRPQVDSMQFDCGYLPPYFVTDPERMEVIFESVYVLIHEKKISSRICSRYLSRSQRLASHCS